MWDKIKEIGLKQHVMIVYIILIIFTGIILATNHDYLGPTSKNEVKYYEVNQKLDSNSGDFFIHGKYESKGIISSNKDIKLYVDYIQYFANKKDSSVNRFPNNITATICPDTAGKSNDLDKYACFDIVMNAIDEDEYTITYRNEITVEKNIQFISSGKLSLFINLIPFGQINQKDVFEIAPGYVNTELQFTKYMFILTLVALAVPLIQIISLFKNNIFIVIFILLVSIILFVDFIY